MTDTGTAAGIDARRLRLRAEFAAFYVAGPVGMAVLLPPERVFTVLFALTGVGLVLLHFTRGFRWRELVRGAGRIDWGLVAAFGVATLAVAGAVVALAAPGAAFLLLRERPGLLAAIFALYPLLSALPQELVFRPLFFRRYAEILPRPGAAVLLNAAAFALAHLMYWSWVVLLMTFAGGLIFAHAYAVRGNFPQAVLLHSLAGWIVFAFGLGVFFYSGNVERPF